MDKKQSMSASFGTPAAKGHNDRQTKEEGERALAKQMGYKAGKDVNLEDTYKGKDYYHSGINPDRTHLNEVILNQPLREAYKELFGDALDKYNDKQTRDDRKITDYYEKIKSSKQEKLVYEGIIQIGNKDTNPADNEMNVMISGDIYREFLKKFQKEFPQFKIVQATIHNDESTPHMHFEYVPFSKNNKRGLEIKNSHSGAMRQMGYAGKKIIPVLNAKCLKLLQKAAWETHKIERIELGIKAPHLTLQDYVVKEKGEKYNYKNDPILIKNLYTLCETVEAQEQEKQALRKQLVEALDAGAGAADKLLTIIEHLEVGEVPLNISKAHSDAYEFLESISKQYRAAQQARERAKAGGGRFAGVVADAKVFADHVRARWQDFIINPAKEVTIKAIHEIDRARQDLKNGVTTLSKINNEWRKIQAPSGSAKGTLEGSVDKVALNESNAQRAAIHKSNIDKRKVNNQK